MCEVEEVHRKQINKIKILVFVFKQKKKNKLYIIIFTNKCVRSGLYVSKPYAMHTIFHISSNQLGHCCIRA